MSFTIKALVNQSFNAGKLVEVTKFLVVDADGNPVVSKFFESEADAQAQIDALGNLSEGLSFAKAQFGGLADKAQRGKANVVAEYLDWIAAGRPVKEVAEAEPAEATEEAATETDAQAGAAALSAGEDF
ncbi:hypotheticla protein [Erwinia phage vB_EamP-S2]|uniref:Hypotheticla protein n=1 Tax=Erwinia phage vB_EamP-S2 TaxID=2070198 RepID=A0A2K9V504_9CAUD|nr:hypotheticla protein [Erwinia phage vB_EamP-S2]AUV57219.1 hypotheticla protein [Erwinia phage vB_EamP-S2]